jgi:hypothetical protein
MFTTESNIASNPTPKYGKLYRQYRLGRGCNNRKICTVNPTSPLFPNKPTSIDLAYSFLNNYDIKQTDAKRKSAKFPYDFSRASDKFFPLASGKDIVNTNKLAKESYIGVISNDRNKPDEFQKNIEKIVLKFIAEDTTEKNYYFCSPQHVMGIKLRRTVEDMVVLYFYDPNNTYRAEEYVVHNPNNALEKNILDCKLTYGLLGDYFNGLNRHREKRSRYPKIHDILLPCQIEKNFKDSNGIFTLCSYDCVEIENADTIIIDESDQARTSRINLVFMKLLSGLPLSEKDKDFFNNNATKIADLNKTYALGFNLVELLSMIKQDRSLKKFVFNILNHENLSSKEKVNILNKENSTLMSTLLKFNRTDDLSFFIDTILESNLDYNDKIELLKVTPKESRNKFDLKINTSYFPHLNRQSSSVLSSLVAKLVYIKQILTTSKLSLADRIKLLIPENPLSFLLSIPVYIVAGILECPFFLLKAILDFLNKFIKADENIIRLTNYILYAVLFPYLFAVSFTIFLVYHLIATTKPYEAE